MKGISGNVTVVFQAKNDKKYNAIGEQVGTWSDSDTVKGWIDLSGGEASYNGYNAKIQDSTHVFICDYQEIKALSYDLSEIRLVCNGKTYEITLVDNPMELNQQLEIFLKYVGGG